jgi:hypothetical protein
MHLPSAPSSTNVPAQKNRVESASGLKSQFRADKMSLEKVGLNAMNKFDSRTIAAMRAVLVEVCSHIPPSSSSTRVAIASRLLECASMGEKSYGSLLAVARRAVIDQFGNVDAIRTTFR